MTLFPSGRVWISSALMVTVLVVVVGVLSVSILPLVDGTSLEVLDGSPVKYNGVKISTNYNLTYTLLLCL